LTSSSTFWLHDDTRLPVEHPVTESDSLQIDLSERVADKIAEVKLSFT